MSDYYNSKFNKIMKAPKMWIDGTVYDIRPKKVENWRNKEEFTLNEQHKCYSIAKDDNGKLLTSFCLPSAYFDILASNVKLQTILNTTNTELNKLKMSEGEKTEKISITGDNYGNVAAAREKFHDLLSDIRENQRALQFISIPTMNEEIQVNFKKFKENILTCGKNIHGMAETIFQAPEKLHLTIAVFVLLDDFEKEEAVKALNTCKAELIDKFMENKTGVKIRVEGINCMTTNHKKASVLYANAKFVDATDELCLQKLANGISTYFYNKGLIKENSGNVKLHITLINTRYRYKDIPDKSMQKQIPFDATHIMEMYKNYYFGEVNFDEVHLSVMSAQGEDGFYEPLSVIKI